MEDAETQDELNDVRSKLYDGLSKLDRFGNVLATVDPRVCTADELADAYRAFTAANAPADVADPSTWADGLKADVLTILQSPHVSISQERDKWPSPVALPSPDELDRTAPTWWGISIELDRNVIVRGITLEKSPTTYMLSTPLIDISGMDGTRTDWPATLNVVETTSRQEEVTGADGAKKTIGYTMTTSETVLPSATAETLHAKVYADMQDKVMDGQDVDMAAARLKAETGYTSFADLYRAQAITPHDLAVALNAIELPRQGTVKPAMIHEPIAKPVQKLFNSDTETLAVIFDEGVGIDVSGRGEKKKGRQVITAMSADGLAELIKRGLGNLDRPITEYDLTVWTAAVNFCLANPEHPYATSQQLAALMGYTRATPTTVEHINASIERMSVIRPRIDATEQLRGRTVNLDGQPTEGEGGLYVGYLMPAEYAWFAATNGRVVEGWHFLQVPLIYYYAKDIGEIVTYPAAWLGFGEMNETDQTVILKNRLAALIAQFTTPKNRLCMVKDTQRRICYRIAYDTLLASAGIDTDGPSGRRARARAINTTHAILDDYKAAGVIAGYVCQTMGRKQTSADIYVPKTARRLR